MKFNSKFFYFLSTKNSKNITFIIFGIVELTLFVTICLLAYKVYIRYQLWNRVKGVQITAIDKKTIFFDKQSDNLKEFYEPVPNRIETAHPDWLGYEVKYTINSDTLNERFDYSIQKLPNVYRVITLGDSFTYGTYVNTTENYSEKLEDILNASLKCATISKFEVINLGVLGYDITYEVERFKKRGSKYNPDLVLWLVNFWNFDKVQEYIIPLYKKYEELGIQEFDPKARTYPRSNLAYNQINKEYGVNTLLNFSRTYMLNLSQIYQGKLILFGSPYEFDSSRLKIIQEFLKTNVNIRYEKKLTSFWDNPNYRLLDLHPNTQGHQKIAEDIFDYLLKNELKECKVKN